MQLAEVEIDNTSRRARCCTRATAYARLQFGHLGYNLLALVEIITVDIDYSRTAY
jgi:hypothetical protein